jgi:hypothetical protein
MFSIDDLMDGTFPTYDHAFDNDSTEASDISEGENNDMFRNTEFIGDILQESKPDDQTRFYIQNLHGIKWDSEGGSWPSICDSMSAIRSNVSLFTELNGDVNDFTVQQKMDSIGKRFFDQQYKFVSSTSSRKVPKFYKPGRTGILAAGDITNFIKSQKRDRMGRWASIQIEGPNGVRINVIIAYQVCQTRITGKNTAANQQISQIIEESANAGDATPRLNPRKAFIRDL